jgi:hypothetical protein
MPQVISKIIEEYMYEQRKPWFMCMIFIFCLFALGGIHLVITLSDYNKFIGIPMILVSFTCLIAFRDGKIFNGKAVVSDNILLRIAENDEIPVWCKAEITRLLIDNSGIIDFETLYKTIRHTDETISRLTAPGAAALIRSIKKDPRQS